MESYFDIISGSKDCILAVDSQDKGKWKSNFNDMVQPDRYTYSATPAVVNEPTPQTVEEEPYTPPDVSMYEPSWTVLIAEANAENGMTQTFYTLEPVAGKDKATVDWGDGTEDTSLTHTYAIEGKYTIIIKDCQHVSHEASKDNIVTEAVQCGNVVTSCYSMFYKAPLKIIHSTFKIPDIVKDLGFFASFTPLTYVPNILSGNSQAQIFNQMFQASKIHKIGFKLTKYATDMYGSFQVCKDLQQDINEILPDVFVNSEINMGNTFLQTKITGTAPAKLLWENPAFNKFDFYDWMLCFKYVNTLDNINSIPLRWGGKGINFEEHHGIFFFYNIYSINGTLQAQAFACYIKTKLNLSNYNSDFTLCAIANVNVDTNRTIHLISQKDILDLYLTYTNKTTKLGFKYNTSPAIEQQVDVNANQFNVFAVTYTNNTITLYVNGIVVATKVEPNLTFNTSTETLCLLNNTQSTQYDSLKSALIFKRALTQGEIEILNKEIA